MLKKRRYNFRSPQQSRIIHNNAQIQNPAKKKNHPIITNPQKPRSAKPRKPSKTINQTPPFQKNLKTNPLLYIPLAIKIPLSTAPSAPVRPILCRLPHRLPRLRRRLHVHPRIHPRNRRPSHHYPRRGLPHRRIIVQHPTGRRSYHPQPPLVLDLIPRHNIHQKIKYIRPSNRRGDIILLQRPPLVLLRVQPRPYRQLQNEELAGLGEEDWGLRRDHPHILIRLHNLLDAGQRQLVVLEVVHLLDLLALVGPKHLKLLLLLLQKMVKGLLWWVWGGLGLLVVLHFFVIWFEGGGCLCLFWDFFFVFGSVRERERIRHTPLYRFFGYELMISTSSPFFFSLSLLGVMDNFFFFECGTKKSKLLNDSRKEINVLWGYCRVTKF